MVVEDGTGLPDADTFVSTETAAQYLTARGFIAFDALPKEAQEAAVINATEYLSSAFGWVGYRATEYQALAWPRYPGDSGRRVPAGVPNAVVAATIRVAYAVSQGADLFAAVSGSDLIRRAKAGSVEVEFNDFSAKVQASGRASMPWLEDLLAGLITYSPNDPGDAPSWGSAYVERV